MKKAVSLFLAVIFIISCFAVCAEALDAGGSAVVSQGESTVIAIPENSTYQQRYSARFTAR